MSKYSARLFGNWQGANCRGCGNLWIAGFEILFLRYKSEQDFDRMWVKVVVYFLKKCFLNVLCFAESDVHLSYKW